MCRTQAVHPASDTEHADATASSFGIGELFRQWGEEYIGVYKPGMQQIKLIRAIRVCRTPAMGGMIITCRQCGEKHYIYKSCGHSHCMLCQRIKREQWMDKLHKRLLKVPYIHTTITIPHQLNRLFRNNQKVLYGALMRACWKTIHSLYADYDVLPGMTTVLHTFGSDMKYHIHVHALITYGGIDAQGKWRYPPTRNKIASFRTMCSTFKKVLLASIEKLNSEQALTYNLPIAELLEDTAKKRWVVHSTRPTMDTKVIQSYLARYINRTAISPSRLQYLPQHNEVHILYNDYKQQQSGQPAPKSMKSLHPIDAIHQIMQHVLPPMFNKTRHYGLHQYSTKQRATVPDQLKNNGATIRTVFEILRQLLKLEPFVCQKCGSIEVNIDPIHADPGYITTFLFYNKAPPAPMSCHATTKTQTSRHYHAHIPTPSSKTHSQSGLSSKTPRKSKQITIFNRSF